MSTFSRRRLLASAPIATAMLASSLEYLVRPAHSAAVPAGWIYTADEGSNSISAIDLERERVSRLSPPIKPHNVQIAGRLLLTVGPAVAGAMAPGHAGGTGGRLLAYSAPTLASEPVVAVDICDDPSHVVADPEARLAYVTCSGDDSVAIVDLARAELVGRIGTGSFPHGLRMSPSGRELLVANVEDGSVSLLSTAERRELARLKVGRAPVQVAFAPGGERAYVSLRDDNAVAVLDLRERRLVGTVSVGRGPIQLVVGPDGREVYVANQGTEAEPDDIVSIIDAQAGRVIETVRVGRGPHGVALSETGSHVCVSSLYADTVSIIDAASRRVLRTFEVGRAPNGITFQSTASSAS